MIESAAGVAGLGTILGVWAHPDDEVYLSPWSDGFGPGCRLAGGVRDRDPRRARHAGPGYLATG